MFTSVILVSALMLTGISADRCTLNDKGFGACIGNVTNLVILHIQQIGDDTCRTISNLPEPKSHAKSEEVTDDDSDEAMVSWPSFKKRLTSIIEQAFHDGIEELRDGLRTLNHGGGVYDVRSLICLYRSLVDIKVKGGQNINKYYETLPTKQKERYSKQVILPILFAAKAIDNSFNKMSKDFHSCYRTLW